MFERNVGTLVVIDHANKPIGILTDRDLVVRVLAQNQNLTETCAADVMTKDPKTVSVGAPIEHALALMRSGCFRRLPVVNDEGTLVGLVSLDDILSLLAEELREVGTLVDKEMPPGIKQIRL